MSRRLASHPLNSPYAQRSTAPPGGLRVVGVGDGVDLAWQAPTDPLKDVKRAAGIIHREIPITTTATSWTVFDVRLALEHLVAGQFDRPAQLVDALFGDSRVQASMASRTGGLLGRSVDFAPPKEYRDSDLAKECAEAFGAAWPAICGESVLSEVDAKGIVMGFAPGQLLWQTDTEYATPHLTPWHQRYTYWHPTERAFIAIGQDVQERITPGDGHWFLYAPYGVYRGWMRGAVRAIAPWWLARNYALRDWARYSERHGFPIVKAKTPSDADGPDIDRYRTQLENLGQESVLECPQGKDETETYDAEYLETKDQSWDGFEALIAKCDAEITLAIMSQNLTTEVKEGSFAAARVHADVRQSLLEADARSLGFAIYTQIARPFAAMNFGNADLAPRITWDVKPYEDDLTAAQTFLAFSQGLSWLARAELGVDKVDSFARRFAIDMGAAKFIKVAAPAPLPEGPDEDEE